MIHRMCLILLREVMLLLKVRTVFKCFAYFIAYVFFAVVASAVSITFGGSALIGQWITDMLGMLIFGLVCYRDIKRDAFFGVATDFPGFSGRGVAYLTVLFFGTYVFSQAFAAWVSRMFPAGNMSVYTELSGVNLAMYSVLALTVGPVCEELLFRGIIYRRLRVVFGLWFSVAVSAVSFTLIHGTTAHIPVTISLTLLICFVMELTGKLRYAIVLHMLYNYFGLIYILPVHWPVWFIVFGFISIFSLLVFSLLRISAIRKFLLKGGCRTLEEYFDACRKRCLDDHKDNDSKTDIENF